MTLSARATAGIGHNKPPKLQTCPCCEYTWEPGRPRSLPQHRRFFALVKQAYDNWPMSHERQFSNLDECRRWLTAKAGYYEVKAEIPLAGVKPELARILVDAAIQAAGGSGFPAVHKGVLKIIVASSVRFNRMGPQEFGALCDDVSATIEREAGISTEALLPRAMGDHV
jgi:hypothetical protein